MAERKVSVSTVSVIGLGLEGLWESFAPALEEEVRREVG